MGARRSILFDLFLSKQEEGLHETNLLIENDDPKAEVRLRSSLEELASGCLKYVAITKNSLAGAGSGKTKLDRERMKLCQREIVRGKCLNSVSETFICEAFSVVVCRKQ